jgi:site-specific DNA recombinase
MDYLRPSHSPRKKAVAYIRISSTKQINNESPETQREKIQQYADSNNIEILEDGWFFDEAKSGKNTDREELQNMLKFALSYREKIDHVIVYKMNRASRDVDSYVENVRLVLKAKGITVRSATEQFDDTTMGRFTEYLYVLLGQMDNENKREYTLDNMIALAHQGYYQHPPVVGYDSHKVPNDVGKMRPSLKPNAMAPKVKEVLERYSWGDITKADLTRYAEQIGLRSRYGKVMVESSIDRMLQHPIYAGYIKDRFTDYEMVESNKFEAIISKVIYERNQSLLYSHKNSRKGEIHTKKNEKYVLKGTLMCIGCGNRMYASAPRTGSGGHSPRYHCTKGCKVPSVPAGLVHEEFRDLLKKIKPTQGTLRLFREILRREANNQLGKLNTDIQRLRDELGNISKQRLEAIQKFTMGNLTLEEKNDFIDALDIQKLEVDSRLSEFERQQAIREADIDHATNFMEELDRQWDDADFDLRVRFQKMVFPNGLVYDSKQHKFGTTKISPMYGVLRIQKTSESASEASMNLHLVAGPGLEPGTSWL